jgi:hypothetical protein
MSINDGNGSKDETEMNEKKLVQNMSLHAYAWGRVYLTTKDLLSLPAASGSRKLGQMS